MDLKINVYQVVLPTDNISLKRAKLFTTGMFGQLPTVEDFKKYYDIVIKFELSNPENLNDEDICEYCFELLNTNGINTDANVKNLEILNLYRSLSVGDVLEVNGELYFVKDMGFDKYSLESNYEDNLGRILV